MPLNLTPHMAIRPFIPQRRCMDLTKISNVFEKNWEPADLITEFPQKHYFLPSIAPMPKIISLVIALCLYVSFLLAQVRSIPEFTFQKMSDGSNYSHKDITTGKKTLFLFFDTECPHCMRATSAYNDAYKKLAALNFIMVTMDSKDDVKGFLKTFGNNLQTMKNLTILSDPNKQFIARFLPKKYPSMFLFDSKGQLILYSDEEKDVAQFIQKIR